MSNELRVEKIPKMKNGIEIEKFMPAPPEDRRVRRTKRMLKGALLELIVEKGYDEVSVQEVIDRADVGRTSFYTYFRSKEDLLLRSLEDLGQLLDGDPGDRSDGGEGSPCDFVIMLFKHFEENRQLARGLLGNRSIPVVRELVQDQFLRHFRNDFQRRYGRAAGAHEIEGAAVFASGALISLVLWWFDMPGAVSPERMGEIFRGLLLPGLGSFFRN